MISKSKLFPKDIGVTFYHRAPFLFDDYPPDKHDVEKVTDYDVPRALNITDD